MRTARALAVLVTAAALASCGNAGSPVMRIPDRSPDTWTLSESPTAPATATARPSPGPLPTGPLPVLLVHGYGGTPAELARVAAALRARGLRVVALSLPARGTPSLDSSVVVLAAAARKTGAAAVDVVGYSLGGVVAARWAATSPSPPVRRLVTVGTPYRGLELEPAVVDGRRVPCDASNACGQLRPGAPVFAGLATRVVAGALTIFYSESDRLVTPALARPAGVPATSMQAVCPALDAGHGDIVSDRQAVGMIVAAVLGAPPRPGVRGECERVTRLG